MFNYENQGRLIYLVYGIKEEDEIDRVILGMLTNNEISGMAPITYTKI